MLADRHQSFGHDLNVERQLIEPQPGDVNQAKVQLIQRKPHKFTLVSRAIFSVMDAFTRRNPDVDPKVVPRISQGLFVVWRSAPARHHQGEDLTRATFYAALATRLETTVVTVLDCGRLHQLSGIKREVLRQLWYKLPLRRLGAITTISEETKRDLLTWVPELDPSKIHVVPVSVSPLYQHSPKDFNSKAPRVLQVGTTPNKNIPRLARALRGLNAKLVIVGRFQMN